MRAFLEIVASHCNSQHQPPRSHILHLIYLIKQYPFSAQCKDIHDVPILHIIAVLLQCYHGNILKETVYALQDISGCPKTRIQVQVILNPMLFTGIHLAALNVVKSP